MPVGGVGQKGQAAGGGGIQVGLAVPKGTENVDPKKPHGTYMSAVMGRKLIEDGVDNVADAERTLKRAGFAKQKDQPPTWRAPRCGSPPTTRTTWSALRFSWTAG